MAISYLQRLALLVNAVSVLASPLGLVDRATACTYQITTQKLQYGDGILVLPIDLCSDYGSCLNAQPISKTEVIKGDSLDMTAISKLNITVASHVSPISVAFGDPPLSTDCPDSYSCGTIVTPQYANITGNYTCKKGDTPKQFEVHLAVLNSTDLTTPAANGSSCIVTGSGPLFNSCIHDVAPGGKFNADKNGTTQPYVFTPSR